MLWIFVLYYRKPQTTLLLFCSLQTTLPFAINKDGKDRDLPYTVSNVIGLCNSFKWLSGRVGMGWGELSFSDGSKLRILNLLNGKKQK